MAQVQAGDVVQVHYTGRLTGGAVFGTSPAREPVVAAWWQGLACEGANRGYR